MWNMKHIVLITILVVGVSSNTTEVTSTLPRLLASPKTNQNVTNQKISTSLQTKPDINAANRREGISYSTSVIHRGPTSSEKEAASSIDFHLNTDMKSTYTEKPSYAEYTTPKQLHQFPEEYAPQSQDASHSHGPFNIIYGKNQATTRPNLKFVPNKDVSSRLPEHIIVKNYASGQDIPHNHQPYHKPVFAQTAYVPTHHKHTVNGARIFKQNNIHITHGSHGSHGNHGSHSSIPALPVPQAYTQAVYHKPEATKLGKAISFSHGNNQHTNPQQTQSFNVGYSVKFGNEQASQINQKRKPYKPIHIDSDIITGSHKEEVNKPLHLSSLPKTNYPTHGHDDLKYYSASSNNPQQILNLTPKTQKQLALLESIQNHKFMQKEPIQNNFPWKSLSPTVEIYRSKDISEPTSTRLTTNFDHEKAIGKSEGFDYTNAVNYGSGNIAQIPPQHLNNPGLNVESPNGRETQQVQVQTQLELQPYNHHLNDQLFVHSSHLDDQNSDITKLPAVPKLPMDTTLLREPFITVHKDQMLANEEQLPIHFDTTLIKGTNQGYGEIISPEEQTYSNNPTYDNNYSQSNNLFAEQSQQYNNYQLLTPTSNPPQFAESTYKAPKNPEDEMTFSFPQNGLFNPIIAMAPKPKTNDKMPVLFTSQGKVKAIDEQLFKHLKMYKVKENVSDHVQPQLHKFKVFGKPGNTFMRHQYEKMKHEGFPLRTENDQYHSRPSKKLVREYTNIEMDLRPPPQAMPFKTTNFLRIKH